MSTPAISGGGGLLTGFTKLCKGLAVVLVGGHIVVQLFPPAVTYLALIPARTIPFAWNLLTAGYFEQTVAVSTFALLFIGKLLEPIWGSKEFVKFIIVVNLLTYVCVFITAIALYYATRLELYLYMPISGFHGVLSGFLVGIKQIIPDQELSVFGIAKIKAKWLPSIMILLSVTASFFLADSAAYLPMIIFGTYMSWIYLRYLQRRSETNFRGDPSDEPVISPISSIFHRMFCGRSEISSDGNGYGVGETPLPGSDSIEASRRRERGARALEERLATERLVAAKGADGSHIDASEEV
ncbi:Rhomboid-like protein 19 [Bienertia sinuspersici]